MIAGQSRGEFTASMPWFGLFSAETAGDATSQDGKNDAESGSAVRSRVLRRAVRGGGLRALRRRGSAACSDRITANCTARHERLGARSAARDTQRSQRRNRSALYMLDVARQRGAARPWVAAPQATALTHAGVALAFLGVSPGRESSGARNASYASPEALGGHLPSDVDELRVLARAVALNVRLGERVLCELNEELGALEFLQCLTVEVALGDSRGECATALSVARHELDLKLLQRHADFAEDLSHARAAYHARGQSE